MKLTQHELNGSFGQLGDVRDESPEDGEDALDAGEDGVEEGGEDVDDGLDEVLDRSCDSRHSGGVFRYLLRRRICVVVYEVCLSFLWGRAMLK